MFENLDVVMLALDEICDGGVVLESDPAAVVGRVALRTDDIPLGEQTVAQVGKQETLCLPTGMFGSKKMPIWHVSHPRVQNLAYFKKLANLVHFVDVINTYPHLYLRPLS